MIPDNSIQPKSIRPGSPTIFTAYQLQLKIDSESTDADQAFDSAIRQVLGWVQEKYPAKLPDNLKQSFKCDLPGQKVICSSHENFWAVKIEQPDSPFAGRDAISGRTWTTDISIALSGESLSFGIKVTCANIPGCNEEIVFSRPRVVKDISDNPGLRDCVKIHPNPLCVGHDLNIDEFYNFVTDPTRSLPIIVLSQPDIDNLPIPVNLPYVLDEKGLAEKTFSYAHVVLLPWAESFKWTAKVGKSWSVFNGAVRIYHTGLNFETNPLYCHPLTLLERILFWNDPNSKTIAERAFTAFLVNAVRTNSTARIIDWSSNPFVNDVELMVERAEQKILATYLQNSMSDQETLRVLRSQNESFDREIKLLNESIKEKEADKETYLNLATDAERDKSYYEDENKKLRAHINSLRMQLENRQKQKIDDAIKIPSTLDELPEWVSENLIGRIVLHPRALQGLKKSDYENSALVYRALVLLANQYRNMRIGQNSQNDYFAARDVLQLRDGGSIDESRAGEFDNTYFVQYPVGSTTRRFLEYHLRCKSSVRDPRRCLAIYYFWDEESQQVVIGWLPSHLENKMT